MEASCRVMVEDRQSNLNFMATGCTSAVRHVRIQRYFRYLFLLVDHDHTAHGYYNERE